MTGCVLLEPESPPDHWHCEHDASLILAEVANIETINIDSNVIKT